MRHYSNTQFNLFNGCPQAYKFRYIDKLPERTSEFAILGRLIHDIIAEYDRHLLANKLGTDITALPKIAALIMGKQDPGHGIDWLAIHWEMDKIVEAFGGAHVCHPEVTVGVEETIDVPIDDETTVTTRLDLLEIEGNVATIVDYKTDHQIRSQTDVEKDSQLHRYAWAVSKAYPQVEEFRGRLEFVRYGAVREVILDGAAIDKTEEAILAQIARMKAETAYLPTPGAGCAWCSYINQCEAIINIGDQQIVCLREEDADRIADELALLERQVDDRKAALKFWCNKHGNVVRNGLAWGFWPSFTDSIGDIQKFHTLVAGAGLDPYAYLKVDMTQAKKLYKHPAIGDKVQSLVESKPSTRFDSKKHKEGDAY